MIFHLPAFYPNIFTLIQQQPFFQPAQHKSVKKKGKENNKIIIQGLCLFLNFLNDLADSVNKRKSKKHHATKNEYRNELLLWSIGQCHLI